MSSTKILFVTSAGRSGSTLLGTLLGQLPRTFNLGEMRMIWHRSILEDRACGCGSAFADCPVWGEILANAFGGVTREQARHNYAQTRQFTRTRHLPRMLFPPTRRRAIAAAGPYLETLGELYRAVAEESGSTVIVDTSKTPGYGRALQDVPGLDVYVLQLIRDPRAVSYSWVRKKIHPDTGEQMGTKGLSASSPVAAGIEWGISNLAAEMIMDTRTRYMRLGYEELILRPKDTVDAIGRFVGEATIAGDQLPINGDTVDIDPTHSVFGNPNRFEVGSVRLRVDDEWRTGLSTAARVGVTATTWPLLRRYRATL